MVDTNYIGDASGVENEKNMWLHERYNLAYNGSSSFHTWECMKNGHGNHGTIAANDNDRIFILFRFVIPVGRHLHFNRCSASLPVREEIGHCLLI